MKTPSSSGNTVAPGGTDSPAPAAGPSAWSPLRRPVFRSVWTAWIVSNTGTWMQNVGAAWLMTSLTSSPLLVALMQTATSLPIFLVGLPAGVLADVVDRRKLLLVTQSGMLLAALTLGLLTLVGLASAWVLLAFTFLIGLGAATTSPAWNAVIPELVEREELPAAVALNSAGYHIAQAVGPALGGFVVAAAGAAAAFLLNAASFLAVLVAIFRWRPDQVLSDAPPENMVGATTAGMRYVRNSPALQAVLVRVGVFSLGASAFLALLPVIAKQELGFDATGYGIILACFGFGAVGGAALLPRLRRSLSVDTLTTAATLVFASATLALAYLRFVPLVLASAMVGGFAWLAMLSTLTVAAQTAAPAWVRARALGMYLLVFQGLLAVGSFAWGFVAQQFGIGTALAFAALALVVGAAATLRWPLHVVQSLDLTPSMHWPDPEVAITPAPEDGPVLITVEYRVPAARSSEFIRTMDDMRTFRRREGAVSWGLFRDAADPDRYVENFLTLTWAEHMRQHARVTVEDQALEERRNSFLEPGVAPVAYHLIDAHAFDARTSAEPIAPEQLPFEGV